MVLLQPKLQLKSSRPRAAAASSTFLSLVAQQMQSPTPKHTHSLLGFGLLLQPLTGALLLATTTFSLSERFSSPLFSSPYSFFYPFTHSTSARRCSSSSSFYDSVSIFCCFLPRQCFFGTCFFSASAASLIAGSACYWPCDCLD